MNGSAYFFAFAVIAFPTACVALIGLRRKVRFWLWLERQWEARQAMVAARSKRKRSHVIEQFVFFPEVAKRAEKVQVFDWSQRAPRAAREEVRS